MDRRKDGRDGRREGWTDGLPLCTVSTVAQNVRNSTELRDKFLILILKYHSYVLFHVFCLGLVVRRSTLPFLIRTHGNSNSSNHHLAHNFGVFEIGHLVPLD